MNQVAESIQRGLEEAVAYAEGRADAKGYGVHVPLAQPPPARPSVCPRSDAESPANSLIEQTMPRGVAEQEIIFEADLESVEAEVNCPTSALSKDAPKRAADKKVS